MEILGVIIDYSYVVMRVNGTCLNPESREVIESLINADRLDVKQFRQGIWEFSAKTQHRAATAGKVPKAWALSRFWVSILSCKKQTVKKILGKILDLASLKFAVAA